VESLVNLMGLPDLLLFAPAYYHSTVSPAPHPIGPRDSPFHFEDAVYCRFYMTSKPNKTMYPSCMGSLFGCKRNPVNKITSKTSSQSQNTVK